jgi:hypothetical protein
MAITDSQLQGISLQALNMAKRDWAHGPFNVLLASYHEGEGLHRMRRIERLLIKSLGEDWLNNDRTKDQGFGVLKTATATLPPDAVVIVTASNCFEPTPGLLALSFEEQQTIMGDGHDDQHSAVKEGWLTVSDALTAFAQNPERVCISTQKLLLVSKTVRPIGQPIVQFFDQSDFKGRLKLYSTKSQNHDFILKKGYQQ